VSPSRARLEAELGLQSNPPRKPARPARPGGSVDSTGNTVAQQSVASLKFVRFSVPRAPGHTPGLPSGTAPDGGGTGGTQVFWWRLFDWPLAAPPALRSPAALGSRVALGCGRRRHDRQMVPPELVVTASEQGTGPLFMDLGNRGPRPIRDSATIAGQACWPPSTAHWAERSTGWISPGRGAHPRSGINCV